MIGRMLPQTLRSKLFVKLAGGAGVSLGLRGCRFCVSPLTFLGAGQSRGSRTDGNFPAKVLPFNTQVLEAGQPDP